LRLSQAVEKSPICFVNRPRQARSLAFGRFPRIWSFFTSLLVDYSAALAVLVVESVELVESSELVSLDVPELVVSLDVSELVEVSELVSLEASASEEVLLSTKLVTEEPDSPSSFPPAYTLITLTASARTKNTITAAMVALLSIASLVLPAFFWKKLSDEVPEMLCDICVLVSFIRTITTINTQATIRTIALIISKIFIIENILQLFKIPYFTIIPHVFGNFKGFFRFFLHITGFF